MRLFSHLVRVHYYSCRSNFLSMTAVEVQCVIVFPNTSSTRALQLDLYIQRYMYKQRYKKQYVQVFGIFSLYQIMMFFDMNISCISLLQSRVALNNIRIGKCYSSHIISGTLCGYHMCCMQFVTSQLKRTNSQAIQQPVLNHDRVLIAKFYQFFIHHASASQFTAGLSSNLNLTLLFLK